MAVFSKKQNRCRNAATKKAFTLTEMLVCILCIGLLTIALTIFYTSVTGSAQTIAKQKDITLREYSDISYLTNSNKSPTLLLSDPSSLGLSYPEKFIEAARIKIGDAYTVEHGINMQSWYKLKYTSADPSIASVDNYGMVRGVSEGITYITVTLYTVNGAVETETDVARVFPVQIYSSSAQAESRGIRYYFYNGDYVKAWVVEDGEV